MTQKAIFGGGCFWCTEAVFQMLKGIIGVMPGYAGGTLPNPTYDDVCSGRTGHAEVIQIEFDPALISYNDLLTVFFATHDPTTMNRQGNDVGEQYRSVILTTTPEQQQQAQAFVNQLNESNTAGKLIVTEIKPLDVFYPAEGYHHSYYQKNSSQAYCQMVINPKLEKVKKKFAELLDGKISSKQDK